MSTNLDKSLDDIIGETPRRSGRRGGRQNNKRDSPNRNSPYPRRDGGGVQKRTTSNAGGGMTKQQQAIMFNPAAFMAAAQQQQQQQQGASSGRIHISNLDYAVSEADIRALFGQVGPVRSATLNYGPNGKSKGTGEVQFRNAAHASLAVEKYHGVTLDGRPMRIEIAFNPMAAGGMLMPAMMPAPVMQPAPANTTRGRRSGAGNSNNSAGGNRPSNNAGSNASSNASGGNASGGRGNRRGRGRRNDSDKRSPMSKEDLDADLDSYMQDAEKPATA
ncbi:RNA-binding RNA annealing protein [Coemansia sp. RSA 2050]|nr:RNA-binding RNA annealing protein [Coemansia sp. RSA 2050]KAJ2729891.1 RNA-binding RNA annealing protein [Coemansia sp. BCRC 34962]